MRSLVLGVLLLLACGEAKHDLRVDLRTDYVGGPEVKIARVSLLDDRGEVVATADTALETEDLTDGLRIGTFEALPRGPYRIAVDLLGPVQAPTRTVLVQLEEPTGVTVVVQRACRDVVCPMGDDALSECVSGVCVDPTCTPETPELCPPAECTSDSDCSTGVACASAACVGGACTARGDSASCLVAQYCEPTMGCVVQPCSVNDDCGRCARCGGTECEPVSFQSIHAAHQGVCAIDERGERWCWGNNPGGELGMGDQGSEAYRAIPRNAEDGGNWTHLAIGWGWRSGSGIRSDGTYWTWGGEERLSPEQSGMDTDWAYVSVAGSNKLALKMDNTLWQNGSQVGTDADWARVIAGWDHTCAVKMDGTMHCWGDNTNGELGNGMMGGSVAEPAQIGSDTDWLVASGGQTTSCALKTDGRLFCWGEDYALTPMQVGMDADWVSFIYEWNHGCGVKTDGSIWCVGGNGDGELGTGDRESTTTPVPITMPGPWSQLTVGGHFNCAFHDVDMQWYCWGAGFGLGVGQGADDDQPEPVPLCPAAS